MQDGGYHIRPDREDSNSNLFWDGFGLDSLYHLPEKEWKKYFKTLKSHHIAIRAKTFCVAEEI